MVSFVRLGWREREQALLEYFLADRRPPAWNQWAEVVGRDAREPRFIGDMPHAWISSDYIRSALDLFAYARDEDQVLVVAAGVPAPWIDGEGVAVRGLRTGYGRLDFSLARAKNQVVLTLGGATPPGGFVFHWPWGGDPAGAPVTVNGEPARWENHEIHVQNVPARVVIERPLSR